MTRRRPLPETTIDPQLKSGIEAIAKSFGSLDDAESESLTGDIAKPLEDDRRWTEFCCLVKSTIESRGYIVVRGLEADGGRTLLIVSRSLGYRFSTYGRDHRVVKRFQMTPWTNELSHTTREGHFHTDGNVSAVPPAATAMQCEREDPGAPEFAVQRVAFLPHLLERLSEGSSEDAVALAFLTTVDTAMTHEYSTEFWRGRLVENGKIRYHPQSIRAAFKRFGEEASRAESVIAAVHRAGMDVSVPFHTGAGDVVLVSNRTALHYRGACSVRFIRFPMEFEARSLFVLHMKE